MSVSIYLAIFLAMYLLMYLLMYLAMHLSMYLPMCFSMCLARPYLLLSFPRSILAAMPPIANVSVNVITDQHEATNTLSGNTTQFAKFICSNCKMYFSKFLNIFVSHGQCQCQCHHWSAAGNQHTVWQHCTSATSHPISSLTTAAVLHLQRCIREAFTEADVQFWGSVSNISTSSYILGSL